MGTSESDVRAVFPGVEVAVSIASRLDTPAATRAEQAKMRGWITRCRDCDEAAVAGVRAERVPPTFRAHAASFAVVMDRPALEDTLGDGSRGVARATMHTALRSAKVGGLDAAAWLWAVSCRTLTDGPIPEHRRPNADEKRRCWGNVHDGLWHANTDRVLLVGADAKDLWRPDLTMEQVAGTVGVLWDRYVCMVVDNPMGIVRAQGGEKRRLARRLAGQLGVWREALGEVDGRKLEGVGRPVVPVTASMAKECVECRGEVDWIDRDGLGWCRGHRNERWMECRGLSPDHGVQQEMFG